MTTQSLLFGGPAPIDAVHLPTHAVQAIQVGVEPILYPGLGRRSAG